MFLGRKNQYCESHYIAKWKLQIQCNPNQVTNGIFHRTRTKNFTVHMEMQKTTNSQSSLKKEVGVGGTNLPDFRLYYKPSHQDSMVLAQNQKYRQMEQNRETRDKSTHPWVTLFLKKETRMYNGAKTASSISGAGKTLP